MKMSRETFSLELGRQLDALGKQRNGKVACVVIFTDDEVQFCWPGRMSWEAIATVEEAMLDALVGGLADWTRDGSGSR